MTGPMPPLPEDPTLDELRLALAPAVADAVVFDGWSEAAVRAVFSDAPASWSDAGRLSPRPSAAPPAGGGGGWCGSR